MISGFLRGVGAPLLLAVFAVGALALGGSLREFWSRGTGEGRADDGAVQCMKLVAEFDAYPLLFLGDSFEGLPLSACARRNSPGTDYGIPPNDFFFFIYGECVFKPGESSCPTELQVTILPRCGPRPDFKPDRQETIRGAEADIGHFGAVRVNTPDFSVRVASLFHDAEHNAMSLRATAALRGANALAANLTPDKALGDTSAVSRAAPDKDPCQNTLRPTPFPLNPVVITVDADAKTDGVQADRLVTTTEPFEIALTASAAGATNGYQWELQWDDATLDAISAVEHTEETGAPLCSPAVRNDDAPEGKEWFGGGAGCASTGGTLPDSVTFTNVTLRCNELKGATTEIHLVSGATQGEDFAFGTVFLKGDTGPVATERIDAQVTCGAP
jgi:hypothetical protein